MSVAPLAVTAPRFTTVYVRLVLAVGVMWIGGWIAFLLVAQGDGIVALAVLIGSAIVSARRAGARAAGIVLAEVIAFVALGLQVPLLAYLFADTGPLTLVVVAVFQAPLALAMTRLARV